MSRHNRWVAIHQFRLVGAADHPPAPDVGTTWAPPVVPATRLPGKAKVGSQRTPDGRDALVYNPRRVLAVTPKNG